MAPPAAASQRVVANMDSDSPEAAKLAVWKDALYQRVQESLRENDLFGQDELINLAIIPNNDKALLMRVIQALTDDKLFVTMKDTTGDLVWKWRPAQEAHKYLQLDDEQAMVYSLVDDAGGDGVWSQTIQRRLNMHDSVLKTALKQLQTKGLIAPFKSVEHPNKKMFIKASIQPSARATGGPWYTDQNLDEAFIEDLQRILFDFVKMKSTYTSKHGGVTRTQTPSKGVVKGNVERGKKRDARELNEPPSKAVKISTNSTPKETVHLPLPAGYTDYPTVRELARLLTSSGVTNNTILSEGDVKKLVDVLVWDNLLEPVKVAGKTGYRVSRVAKQSTARWAGNEDPTGREGGPEPYPSPYTEAPCGRCPVFEICEDGGPVGPSNCEYFKKWLGIE